MAAPEKHSVTALMQTSVSNNLSVALQDKRHYSRPRHCWIGLLGCCNSNPKGSALGDVLESILTWTE